MSGYTFMPPPVLTGAAQEQIRQLSSYLYRMNENLNVALNSLSPENFTAAARQTLGSGSGVTIELLQSQYDALVSMIRAVEKANVALAEELRGYIDEGTAALNEELREYINEETAALAPENEVTQDGTKAVSGAAVYAFTEQSVAADGTAPVSGAAVAAYVAAEIAKLGS